jgi:uncharacterized phage protein (predicted DNA packaging)
MSAPATLAEAKLFLRVDQDADDSLIQLLIDSAQARIEQEVEFDLCATSPAPLRLALLMLVLRAYEHGEHDMSIARVESWVASYRQAKP